MKYIILISLLFVGCAKVPYEPSLYDTERFYKENLERLVEKTVIEQLQTMNQRHIGEAADCNNISSCLGKPTYLNYDPRTNEYKCMILGTQKKVTCNPHRK